ncbi:MAG: DUF4286 family protein [Flammeovirgaceae bacterium]|nr:DUF4286 family protein [Flammeovirgaceae bacterium]
MIVYNVTVSVDTSVVEEWLQWMRGEHIPEVMATGCFEQYKLLKVLEDAPNPMSVTFAIQYHVADLTTLDSYLKHHAPSLRAKHQEKFQDKALAFRTVLKEI